MSEQPKEDPKVKDLLVKLQVLTNALLEERNKTKSYLSRLKEYEESLEKKDLEISDLTKEKFDLKSKLTLEKSRKNSGKRNDKYFGSIFNSKGTENMKVTDLQEKINQQNFEIRDLTQRLMEEKESFDQQKIKLQTMLTIQSQQMAELKQKYENSENSKNTEKDEKEKLKKEREKEREREREREKERELEREKEREKEREQERKKEKEREKEREMERQRERERELERQREREKEKEEPKILLSEHKEKLEYLRRQFNSEKDGYEKQLGQIRNELREEKEKSEKLNEELNQYKDKFDAKNYENIAMKSQVNKLNDDVIQLRNELSVKQLKPRMFHVERIKKIGKQALVIIFNWNKNLNICEMIFKRTHTTGKLKEDTINILEAKVKIGEKKDTIEISFKVSYIIIINFFFLIG